MKDQFLKRVLIGAVVLGLGCSTTLGPQSLLAEDVIPGAEEKSQFETERVALVEKGVEYLRGVQLPNGSFSRSPRAGIGMNIVVLIGLLRSGLGLDDETVAKGIDYLTTAVHPDGGIYSGGGQIAIYETCLAVTCLQLAKKAAGDDRYDAMISAGEKFIRGQQYGEENGVTKDDVRYGGLGYGGNSRPDLSNTQFFMETLHELGAGEDDEAIQRALVFVSRCQNLESPENTTKFAAANNDGGFFYTCAGEGESPAGEVNGGLRSYGSITYAGLKSLIYAGVDEKDPRVVAATGWLRENYSTDQNPGLGRRGLYYYYHTMSKTLDVLGQDSFEDASGTPHFWKGELIETLQKELQPDGSWVNTDRMWMENDPVLVTGYALIVLANCSL